MQTTIEHSSGDRPSYLGYINLGCLYGMFAFFSVFGPKIVAKLNPSLLM